ncbi:hypothetical protein [Ochrobactrum soli]|uniref:Uncharacterized protein n=1 Tax=Ochrobactrum soli TaxID=2448455 RepID=A0A2P9HKV2_9HYPH|nr:hypothetical protein [[Ochrobactrum] soli]SPL64440.1 hypothetical protein OHAE_307 [[Ochrobactrum] soli]
MLKSHVKDGYTRILLETHDGAGQIEMVDACVSIGATDKDIIKSADGYDTQRILRFDVRTMRGVDITDDVARSYEGPFDDDAPQWVKDLPNFHLIAADEADDERSYRSHVRACRSPSVYL